MSTGDEPDGGGPGIRTGHGPDVGLAIPTVFGLVGPVEFFVRDTGIKHFSHTVVGRLDLTVDAMEIPTDPGLTMTCYTAEPGTASDENLRLQAFAGLVC
jgi:MmyB-like transcription regulator ligand binding domain